MFKLQTLELSNFRSYRYLLLDNIDTLGLTLISGKNGSGKTSIRNAIEYLLTDTTSENIPLEEFSFNGEGNCILRCVIISDIGKIEITKYREHKKHGNSTILSLNDITDNFTETDRRETQKNIFKILGITKELLPISSIFSQHSQSFTNSKETERKKIIYDAENLHKYTEYSENAKTKERELTELFGIKKTKISTLESDLYEIEESIKEKEDGSARFENNRLIEIEEVEREKSKEIEEYDIKWKNNILGLEETEKELRNKLSIVNKEIEEYDIELDKIQKELKSLPNLLDTQNEKESLLKKRNDLEFEKRETERYIDKIETDTCPILNIECNTLIDKRNKILKETEPKLNKINKNIKTLDKKINNIGDTLSKITTLLVRIDVIADNKKDKNRDTKNIKDYILDATDKISHALKDNKEDLEKILSLIDKRIEDIKVKRNPYLMAIDDLTKTKQSKEQILNELSKEIKVLGEDIKYYSFWKVGFGKAGIPNMKAESFLSALELETNKILATISDRMIVSLDSQSTLKDKSISEKISYRILHPDKVISDFSSYSGGEKQRVVISDIFAFNKLLGRFNFVILDEILEMSLDDEGKSEIIKLLKEKANEIGVILVISHSNQIKDSFDTILEIEKVDGESVCRRK